MVDQIPETVLQKDDRASVGPLSELLHVFLAAGHLLEVWLHQ